MKKLRYPLLLTAFAVSLCISATIPVLAATEDVDIGYSGVIDSDTGTDGEGDTEAESSKVKVADGITYDTDTHYYYYEVDGFSAKLYSNMMDGMVTQTSAIITLPNGIPATLYRNGEEYSGSLAKIEEIGSYTLLVSKNNGITENVLSFTIVNSITGKLDFYTMPEGFSIKSLSFDGNTVPISTSTVSFDAEGYYSLTYLCDASGEIYSLNVTIDNTAPTLKLEGIKNGRIWGPVDVSDVPADATLTVYRDGEKESLSSTKQLTKMGSYELILEDKAGNRTTYSFTIMLYFTFTSVAFFLAVLLILCGVGVYLLYTRKTLRVR